MDTRGLDRYSMRTIVLPSTLLFLASLLCWTTWGQYITSSEINTRSTCYALPVSSPVITNTPVGGSPSDTNGILLFASTLQSNAIRLRCLDIFVEENPSLNSNQSASCLTSIIAGNFSLCVYLMGSNTEVCETRVNDAFRDNPNIVPGWVDVALDRYNTSAMYYTVRWIPSASMPAMCYPLYFTTVTVVTDITPASESSVAAVVIFVVIAAVVVIIILLFGRYQIRKVLAKFGKNVSTKTAAQDAVQHGGTTLPPTSYYEDVDSEEGAHQRYVEQSEEEFRAQYGHHAIKPRGLQQAELVDGVLVTARPLIQPWYERNSFRSPEGQKKQTTYGGGAPVAMQVAHIMGPDPGGHSSVRRRQPSPIYDDQPPIFIDPTVNATGQQGRADEMRSPPRRLNYPAPTYVRYNVTPPPEVRVLNPYEED